MALAKTNNDTALTAAEQRAAAAQKVEKLLMARFKAADKETKKAAKMLAEQAAFMSVTLDELQRDIAENGAVIVSTNGNGFDVKQENPAQKSYNTTIKNYNATIMALQRIAQDAAPVKDADPLMAFIAQNK